MGKIIKKKPMKAYLLLVIVAISISNVSSRYKHLCQRCSSSFIKVWKHCKHGLDCKGGYCRTFGSGPGGGRDQMLASLGNANEEDFQSIDLLKSFGFGSGVGAIAAFFKNRKDS